MVQRLWLIEYSINLSHLQKSFQSFIFLNMVLNSPPFLLRWDSSATSTNSSRGAQRLPSLPKNNPRLPTFSDASVQFYWLDLRHYLQLWAPCALTPTPEVKNGSTLVPQISARAEWKTNRRLINTLNCFVTLWESLSTKYRIRTRAKKPTQPCPNSTEQNLPIPCIPP